MRRAEALLFLLLLGGCTSLRERMLCRIHAPARLAEERLTLMLGKEAVSVTARFRFVRAGAPGTFLCFFPAAGYPVRSTGGRSAHPPLRNFSVTVGTNKLPFILEKKRVGFPVYFTKETTVTIRYTAPWQREGGRDVFRYVLRSGGLWQGGRIGRLTIVLTNNSGRALCILPPYDRQRVFTNFRPRYDITIDPPRRTGYNGNSM